MTRINLIPPSELTRNHLIAEYRELPSIFGNILKAQRRGETPASVRRRAPKTYTLGKGHMLFFYDKVTWLSSRFDALVTEMLKRGYEPQFKTVRDKIEPLDPGWCNWWRPSEDEIAISRARIEERLTQRMTYKNKPGERKAPKRNEWDFGQ